VRDQILGVALLLFDRFRRRWSAEAV